MSLETIDFDRLNIRPGDRLLDLGCGEGRHSISAHLQSDADIIGLDLGQLDLRTAKGRLADFPFAADKAGTCSFIQGTGHTLPFADDTFDQVICSEVLEHIPDYLAAIDEILRVTKPGGRIGISVPRFWPEKICWLLSTDYHNEPGGHIRIFRANELEADFTLRGFKKIARHWAHSLHSPYWWLRCLLGVKKDKAFGVRHYHKLLVTEMMNPKGLVAALGKLLDPIMGKSVVYYFDKK
ncbi:MAG TPA: SAM-dependent methyltransferase [Rhodobiaceae bacterium]|nr:SAM-dependent methyltransferase [Rhodobiaceae bacterium]